MMPSIVAKSGLQIISGLKYKIHIIISSKQAYLFYYALVLALLEKLIDDNWILQVCNVDN